MKSTWLSIWLTLAFLAAFTLAAVYTPETSATRAHHRSVALAWQQKQDEKARRDGLAVPQPLPKGTVRWAASGWAQRLDGWDRRTFQAINEAWDNRFFDSAMPGITSLGNGGVQAAGLLALWLWGRKRKRADWMRTAILSVSGLLLSVVAPQIKLILPRFRPPSLIPYDIVLLVHPLYGGSFPSGHTMSSFAIATVIGMRHRWAAAPAFAIAAIIGLSRISVGVHWPLDVLGGAIIGVLLGFAVVRWDSRRGRETK
ncbi:MAG TPA: phosphatase PAP2 family protein [Armatimonadota bacterium]|jgi:undecaprenyl-diphosphatase